MMGFNFLTQLDKSSLILFVALVYWSSVLGNYVQKNVVLLNASLLVILVCFLNKAECSSQMVFFSLRERMQVVLMFIVQRESVSYSCMLYRQYIGGPFSIKIFLTLKDQNFRFIHTPTNKKVELIFCFSDYWSLNYFVVIFLLYILWIFINT